MASQSTPTYKMPAPKSWLSTQSEILVDSFIDRRLPNDDDGFSHFASVLRRSNPLLPKIITGPLTTLSARVCDYWDLVPQERVKFHALKRQLLDAFCSHLIGLTIFQRDRKHAEERAMLDGLAFYQRPEGRNPCDAPFLHVKRKDRLEAIETCYFITIILSTAIDNPSIDEMPEGPLSFVPYSVIPEYLTAPDRTNAASLALAAKYFRRDTRPAGHVRMFRFDFTEAQWAAGAEEAQATNNQPGSSIAPDASIMDELGYRRIAQVSANSSSTHGAVSYCVLKLLAVKKERQSVCIPALIRDIDSNIQQ
jgi:hypothetical protein